MRQAQQACGEQGASRASTRRSGLTYDGLQLLSGVHVLEFWQLILPVVLQPHKQLKALRAQSVQKATRAAAGRQAAAAAGRGSRGSSCRALITKGANSEVEWRASKGVEFAIGQLVQSPVRLGLCSISGPVSSLVSRRGGRRDEQEVGTTTLSREAATSTLAAAAAAAAAAAGDLSETQATCSTVDDLCMYMQLHCAQATHKLRLVSARSRPPPPSPWQARFALLVLQTLCWVRWKPARRLRRHPACAAAITPHSPVASAASPNAGRSASPMDVTHPAAPTTAWGDLPWPLLGHVMQALSAMLAAEPPLTPVAAAAVAAACSPNRHWAESAARELRLSVSCSGAPADVRPLLQLARRSRLVALRFEQAADDGEAAGAVLELLHHPAFAAAAGQHLRALHGVPASDGGRKHLDHFSPAAYPSLAGLQLYAPPHQQVLSLRGGAWAAAAGLRRLAVQGRHYVALRDLPPCLEHLEVTAWHLLAPDLSALLRCKEVRWSAGAGKGRRAGGQACSPAAAARAPSCCRGHSHAAPPSSQVRLRAAAVLLYEDVLPYPVPALTVQQASEQLRQLAALLARAGGLPPGHTLRMAASLVCFRRPGDGSEAKLAVSLGPGFRMVVRDGTQPAEVLAMVQADQAGAPSGGEPAMQLEFVGCGPGTDLGHLILI